MFTFATGNAAVQMWCSAKITYRQLKLKLCPFPLLSCVVPVFVGLRMTNRELHQLGWHRDAGRVQYMMTGSPRM
ncbi:hypothetical protein SERLA73DRAFT_165530 [Serpula lacrymans var. lacrymans S7.3]|uniref:Uncharacterized protein n=2 Tax=Serpula lacrymans var. lacrymans TaxID=341189 RepID=F8PL94_SERL3|nr:uncharacterized protein SERLADRAFT_379483 [Serpula lacrymans var. lacrymans S7.9]EGO04002.1 hypothetical protein SERLA73DRAFT_165530 [Serpula lacrymans var. lacrymans S7.3]EGO29921.1 hypothetical protein SERLADRAFT_379483 [Serpula lacrymans var. lacrymans S7.9]